MALMERGHGTTLLALRDRAILELFYSSGLRISELTGIDLERLDLRNNLVRVLGKGGKERIVPFGSRLATHCSPTSKRAGRLPEASRCLSIIAADA